MRVQTVTVYDLDLEKDVRERAVVLCGPLELVQAVNRVASRHGFASLWDRTWECGIQSSFEYFAEVFCDRRQVRRVLREAKRQLSATA